MAERRGPRWARRATKPNHSVALWHAVTDRVAHARDAAACAWQADVPPWAPGAPLEWCAGPPAGRRFVCAYCSGYFAGWLDGADPDLSRDAPEEADVERLTRALLGADDGAE